MTRPLSLAALVLALWATACGAQADRSAPATGAAPVAAQTVESTAMARGPAAATVTILEFSDYQ
jgi:hypothetical protein